MIQIGDKIISRELFSNHFICDIGKCEGNCCVFGDSGAPLEDEETRKLDLFIERLLPYMRTEGKRAVEERGTWEVDNDGDKVTPLIGREECAYVYFEDTIARCAIEKAYEEGEIDFAKPVSCHLYPIRVNKLKNVVALNYHKWSVCEPARVLGEVKEMPVFRFLEGPIRRIYGEQFYKELELVYKELNNREKL